MKERKIRCVKREFSNTEQQESTTTETTVTLEEVKTMTVTLSLEEVESMDLDEPLLKGCLKKILVRKLGSRKRTPRRSRNSRSKTPPINSKKCTPKSPRTKSPPASSYKKVLKKTTVVTKLYKTTKTTKTTYNARTPGQSNNPKIKVLPVAETHEFVLTELSSENKYKLPTTSPIPFRAWKADQFVIDTLRKRGMQYLGEPIKDGREDYPASMYDAIKAGEVTGAPCLYISDDDDGRALCGLSQNHIISSLPNADKALTNVYQQTMFKGYSWFPHCYTVPNENKTLFKFAIENPNSYWICKPRDSSGGFGMCVYRAGSEEFKKLINERKTQMVVQRYMENPYLFAGLYKFHLRCYMVVTNARNPLKAYLWRNYKVQFCTHKFNLNQIEKKFNKYCHITNYRVNNEKKNKEYLLKDKPGMGIGSEWSMETFVNYMKANDSRFDEEAFWTKLKEIAKVVSKEITSSKGVVKGFEKQAAKVTNHFELYGLGVLVDENLNLALTKANTQPGLDDTDPIILSGGKIHPEVVRANDITAGVINDTITLCGFADKQPYFSEMMKLW